MCFLLLLFILLSLSVASELVEEQYLFSQLLFEPAS